MTIADLSAVTKIKQQLHQALQAIAPLDECALLDYPTGPNLGSYLLWLATVSYYTDVLKTKIKYVASVKNFSAEAMARQAGSAPIVLRGSVITDYHWRQWPSWKAHHVFYRQIVSRYPDRPIILMPQSIYFVDPNELAATAQAFNAHPNLTVFARDTVSYAIGAEHFHKCRVIQAPDIAFHLSGLAGIPLKIKPKKTALYLRRCEWEDKQNFAPDALGISDLTTDDWTPYNCQTPILMRGLNRPYRALWCRRLRQPAEWFSRWRWSYLHPYKTKLGSFPTNRIAWDMLHTGAYQLQRHRLVVTNRLHGHILSTLLGIPNILLASPHQKMENYYATWTFRVPYCRLATDSRQVRSAAEELLEAYPHEQTGPLDCHAAVCRT